MKKIAWYSESNRTVYYVLVWRNRYIRLPFGPRKGENLQFFWMAEPPRWFGKFKLLLDSYFTIGRPDLTDKIIPIIYRREK